MKHHKINKETIYSGSKLYPVRISLDNIPDIEPYGPVSGGKFTGDAIKWSPDPLSSYRFDSVKADDGLMIFKAYPVRFYTDSETGFEGLCSSVADNTFITVKGKGNIVLDFGVEFAAWLEIESPDLPDCKCVKLSVSEYDMPEIVNKGPQSPHKTGYPKKISDSIYRLELNPELYEGVRFGFIHVESFKKEFHITSIRLICQIKPSDYNGSFYCDNEMLNRIWYTAAYDVRVNLKKDYLAAILIDRGDRHSWTGDAYISQAASLCAFANYDFILDNLKYTASHDNGIESYELYWVLSLIDYYYFTSDKDGISNLLPYASQRLDHAYEIWGKDPSLTFFGWDERQGVGFDFPDIKENQLSYKAVAIECFDKYADMLDALGHNADATRYRAYAKQKIKETLSVPGWYNEYGLHAFADAVNAGLADEDVKQKLFDKYFKDRINRISYCPFNEYFILCALAKMGKYDDAVSSILDLWGGQVIYGGTCFFEVFRPEWNDTIKKNGAVPNNQAGYTSLAHPWSAGVLSFISTELLGIKPVSAGFSTFSVIPHVTTFLNVISGEMPTPHGNIKVSFDITSGKHSVTVPEATHANVAIPKANRTVSGLKLNCKAAEADREDADYFYFDGLGPGDYFFDADYSGDVKKYKAPPRKYAAKFVGVDTETKENCSSKYGKDGYVICGVDKKLPEYVSEVVFSKGIMTLSGYSTNYDNMCSQTFTIDINVAKKRKYTVALYFEDRAVGKSLAVEMFDGKTYDLISPIKALHDYSGGVYLVYEYNGSARFRIDHIRGDFVSLSGIFFDS